MEATFNAICNVFWGVGVIVLIVLGLKLLAEFIHLKSQYKAMKDEAVEFRDNITRKLAQYEASYKDLKANYVEVVEQTDQALAETQGQLDESLKMAEKLTCQADALYSRLERIEAAQQQGDGPEVEKLFEMLYADIQEERGRSTQEASI